MISSPRAETVTAVSTGRPARALLSWSSGKDAAWALHNVLAAGQVEVVGLLTTVNEINARVAMHGVRRVLLATQASAVGLPLYVVSLPWPCSNEVYETCLRESLSDLRDRLNLSHMIFGDLFLSEIRNYREKQMAALNLEPLFPLWGRATHTLACEMIDAGMQATIVCTDVEQIPASFCGQPFDAGFLEKKPASVDACGENGEFHTLVHDGPMFKQSMGVVKGRQHTDGQFVFTDLKPARE